MHVVVIRRFFLPSRLGMCGSVAGSFVKCNRSGRRRRRSNRSLSNILQVVKPNKKIISHKEVSKFFYLRQEPEAEVSHLQPFDFSFKTTNLTIQDSHMGGELVVIVVDSFLH